MSLAATLSLTAVAQECANNGGAGPIVYGPEYSNGGVCQKGRKEATKTPVEAFGVHPPGIDPYDAHRFIHRWRHVFIPYYAPLSPVATSARWKPWCYFPLMPYYTPYYIGYCPHRLCNPKPPPYGSDGWGEGPMPGHDPGPPPLNYGAYTSIIPDDTIFWNMGGNGLVPYGAPRPPHISKGPDLVDMIQVTRAQGYGAGPGGPDGAACQACVGGTPPTILDGGVIAPVPAAGAMLPETQAEMNEKESKRAAPAEAPAQPE